MSKNEKDPYDVFDYILENIDKNGVETKFFFPVGDRSKYDRESFMEKCCLQRTDTKNRERNLKSVSILHTLQVEMAYSK